jgi:hypothetical protein
MVNEPILPASPPNADASPNRFSERQAFYFDDITEGTSSLDIFGDVLARDRGDTVEVNVRTHFRVSRFDGSGQTQGPFYFCDRAVRTLDDEA